MSTSLHIEKNYPLKAEHTFGIEVYARHFATITSTNELSEALELDPHPLFLGGGSNVLFTHDIEGLVIKNGLKGVERVDEDDEHVFFRVAAGELWHDFVTFSLDAGLSGLENLALIPGSVGATPIQNIGAYGREVGEYIHSVEAISIATGKGKIFSATECAFGYRESIFKRQQRGKYCITAVCFRLDKYPHLHCAYGALRDAVAHIPPQNLTPRVIYDVVCGIRRGKLPDPAQLGNAGSFFKNPFITASHLAELQKTHPAIPFFTDKQGTELRFKLPAAWLIEQTGWKGKRMGNAGVHEQHALILVNYGGATGTEVTTLMRAIQDSVYEQFKVTLEPEVTLL